ncbi:hypothetical protein SAMD00019534_095470 [Acytostelium subglobosum LB1]|uniref:hypothetical protein n=1 Tax=Acytostelium subglobosum LB1 TaxID=1410327 RepID=UPI000644BF83|nr:hypothetical protein SAMD00019534_095470 [Acytostelium subglobosum LB1]GAM26372.1 hypothetical protein SAMD00019534_095470 [Acytostelium subglobosum LB1]|eukprot:XP_012750468.1 hypothetical protein SAMD00019534_095470 [Acytostelium subglobosum LB1]
MSWLNNVPNKQTSPTFLQKKKTNSIIIGSPLSRGTIETNNTELLVGFSQQQQQQHPMEYFLESLLDELPSVDTEQQLDFGSMLDRKLYLDVLYQAIVDSSLSVDLLDQQLNAPLIRMSEESIIHASNDIKETTPIKAPLDRLSIELITPVVANESTINDVSSSVSNVVAIQPQVPIPSSSSKNIPPLSSSPSSSAFRPIAVQTKRAASPHAMSPTISGRSTPSPKMLPSSVNPRSSPSLLSLSSGGGGAPHNRVEASPSPPPLPGVVNRRLEQLESELAPPSHLHTKLHQLRSSAGSSSSILDVNQFNMDIERALLDIESSCKLDDESQQPEGTAVALDQYDDVVVDDAEYHYNEQDTKQQQQQQTIITNIQQEKPKRMASPVTPPPESVPTHHHSPPTRVESKEFTLEDLISRYSRGHQLPVATNNKSQPMTIEATLEDVQINTKIGGASGVNGTLGHCLTGMAWSKPVIFKMMNVGSGLTVAMVKQIKDEVTKLKELRHENILPIFGVYHDATNIYLITPFVEAVSLDHILLTEEFKISHDFITRVASGIAKAMCFLHQHNITHRSLSPANVLVDKTGGVVLRDYAFTSIKDNVYQSSCADYIAPEIISSHCAKYNQTCDQYSFALIMWQLFQRQQPFGGNPTNIVDMLAAGFRPSIPANFPSVFDKLIRACWHQDTTARPNFFTIAKILNQPTNRLFSVITKETQPTTQRIIQSPQTTQPTLVNVVSPPPSTSPPVTSPLATVSSPIAKSSTPLQSVSSPATPLAATQKAAAKSTTQAATTSAVVANDRSKRQFHQTGELQEKMRLVLEKISKMLDDISNLEQPLQALEKLSSEHDNLKHMTSTRLVHQILKLLGNGSEAHHELNSLLRVLCQMCINDELSNDFVAQGGLIKVIRLMNSTNVSISIQATKLLTALADGKFIVDVQQQQQQQQSLTYYHFHEQNRTWSKFEQLVA